MRSVLVVDPYPLVRDGLEQLVRAQPALSLAASAACADTAPTRAAAVRADVAVLGAPEAGAVAALAARLPVLALLDDAGHDAGRRRAARGRLRRAAPGSRAGRDRTRPSTRWRWARSSRRPAWRSSSSARAVTLAAPPSPRSRRGSARSSSSSRAGATNGQIAHALGLSTKTVRNHMASVCTKLQVLDRAQAAIAARDAGLGAGATIS